MGTDKDTVNVQNSPNRESRSQVSLRSRETVRVNEGDRGVLALTDLPSSDGGKGRDTGRDTVRFTGRNTAMLTERDSRLLSFNTRNSNSRYSRI